MYPFVFEAGVLPVALCGNRSPPPQHAAPQAATTRQVATTAPSTTRGKGKGKRKAEELDEIPFTVAGMPRPGGGASCNDKRGPHEGTVTASADGNRRNFKVGAIVVGSVMLCLVCLFLVAASVPFG